MSLLLQHGRIRAPQVFIIIVILTIVQDTNSESSDCSNITLSGVFRIVVKRLPSLANDLEAE